MSAFLYRLGRACFRAPGRVLAAWLALLAYAALAIAAVLAIMLRLQERALRQRQFSGWLRVLPPLTELESLLAKALADHRLDDDEKRVLGNVMDRAEAGGVAIDVQARIDRIRREHLAG